HFGYFYGLDPTAVASIGKDSSVGKEIVSKFFGGDIKTFATGFCVALFTVGLMLSSLGTLHTSILSGSRIPYALAKDCLMPAVLVRLWIRNVPVPAIFLLGFLAVVLTLSGSFVTLSNYFIFGSWIFYGFVT